LTVELQVRRRVAGVRGGRQNSGARGGQPALQLGGE
jgi:hypothetical protein